MFNRMRDDPPEDDDDLSDMQDDAPTTKYVRGGMMRFLIPFVSTANSAPTDKQIFKDPTSHKSR